MDREGIRPGEVRSLKDLRRFGLLDRRTVRARWREMVWRGPRRRVQVVRTSGSTNQALEFCTDSAREAHVNAARIRARRWAGLNVGDKELYFWAAPVELAAQDRLKAVRDCLINNRLTSALEITEQAVPKYLASWRRWRPKALFGYPSSFVLVVSLAGRIGLDLTVLARGGLKSICTTAEMLHEADRRLIGQGFGAAVYDSYGLREAGLIGHECEHFTMHTNDEQLILETVDPVSLEPTEGEGELVLTNLVSHVMPIIRYRTGDVVRLSEGGCPCGRSLRAVGVSGGRLLEFVVTGEGKWVSGICFFHVCRAIRGVVQLQVRQDRIGELRVLVTCDGTFPCDGVEQLRAALRARLGGQDEILIEVVDEIPTAPSGKQRMVIGNVARGLLESNACDAKGKSFIGSRC